MFKSLKVQLLFYFSIANIIILILFSLFIYFTAQKGVSDSLDTMMKIISIDVVPDLKEKIYVDAKEISEELISEFGISPLHIKILYFNKNNQRIDYETTSSKEYSKLFDIPLNEMGYHYTIYYFDKEQYRVSSMLLFEDSETKVFLQLATKKIVNSPYLETLLISLLIANPIILVLFFFIANLLISRTLLPMEDVIESVNSLCGHKLSERINNNKIPMEIQKLVDTFNRLLENLEESFDRISSFSSDASHELKTPLTVIRGEIEVALRQKRESEEYKVVLEESLQETIHMQEIIDQLFFISKWGSTEYINNKEEIYLDEILTDVVKQINKFALTKSIKVTIRNIIPVTIYTNETLMKIAISNIFRNAIIYSNEFSEVIASISEQNNHYILKIEDYGCGIAQENLSFIFDRFFRVDKIRSRKESGTGLGLSIVKTILDIHSYEIDVKSVLNKGTEVIIKIPR